jgi:hypothetical protein
VGPDKGYRQGGEKNRNLSLLLIVSLVAVLWTTGCGRIETADCVPAEAVQSETDLGHKTSPANDTTLEAVDVYLDVSGSMRGFLRREGAQKYSDIKYLSFLKTLRISVSSITENDRFHKLGKWIEELDDQEFQAFTEIDTYQGSDFIQESRLDQALNQAVAADEGTVSIIVTDLFMDEADISGDTTAISRPLAQALRKGLAIGVLGVVAPFSGWVYDIPHSRVRKVRLRDGKKRPFFALFIGSRKNVIAIYEELEKTKVFLPGQDGFFHVFSDHLFDQALTYDRILEDGEIEKGPGVAETKLLARPLDRKRQFMINRSDGLSLKFDMMDYQSPYSVPVTDLSHEVTFWQYQGLGGDNCQQRWSRVDMPAGLVDISSSGPHMSLDIMRSQYNWPMDLIRTTCFLKVDLKVREVGQRNVTTQWFYDVSFDKNEAPELVAQPPDVFPVLNLDLLYTFLAGQVEDRMEGVNVGSISMAMYKK